MNFLMAAIGHHRSVFYILKYLKNISHNKKYLGTKIIKIHAN